MRRFPKGVFEGALCLLSIILVQTSYSQLDVVNGLSVEDYVNDVFLGEGVSAFNISYTGGMLQLGQMVNGADSEYAFDEALVMSTANARGISCSSAACSDCQGDANSDPDLLSIANSVPGLIGQDFSVESIHDVSILEFDFIVTGDSIGFDYIFGSDEYETWINTPYNDVFGFFLSGPGIEGPFASPADFLGGAINLAGVPNSVPNLPITVSSVNSAINSEYYVSNLPYQGICINGFTEVFHAGYPVQCGETYHIKLAIADGTDSGLESVVILEQGSFVSNVPVLVSESFAPAYPMNQLIFEGCGGLEWTFSRPSGISAEEAYTVLLDFSNGTAVNGLDFGQLMSDGSVAPFNDSIVFEPGISTLDYSLIALNDELDEGIESIVVTISSVESCLDGFMYLTYEIADSPDPIEIDGFNTIACSNLQIIVQPDVTGGYGNYDYSWSCSTSSQSYLTVNLVEDWSCILTVSDTCGLAPVSAINTINLLDSIPLSVDLQPDSLEITPGDSVNTYVDVQGGLSFGGLYSTAWYVNGELVQAGYDTSYAFFPELFDVVTVEVEDGCGNEEQDELVIESLFSVEAIITALDSSLSGPDSTGFYICLGSETLWSPSQSTSTSDSVLFYLWNWGDGTIEYSFSDTLSHEWDEPGVYAVTLTMADPYESFDISDSLMVTILPKPNVVFQVDSPICIGGIGEAEITVNPSPFTQTVYYEGSDEQLADSMVTTYSFPISVSNFSDTTLVGDCNGLKKVRAQLEHAHVGALDIWVECPNGSQLNLLVNEFNGADACNGDTDVDDVFLGEPVLVAGNDTAGIGYNYTWRPTGVYVLDDENNFYLENGTINPGSYSSCNDWCDMSSCPVNGEWTLHIATQDSLGDGHFFGWNLQFENNELTAFGLDNPGGINLELSSFNWNNLAESAEIIEDSLGFYATYEPFAEGSHIVSFTAVDAFGCSSNRSRMITINDGLGFMVEGGPSPNARSSILNLSASLLNTEYVECPGMPFSSEWCLGNEVDTIFTICPTILGDGSYMHLSFQTALMDSLGDYVVVHDGPDTTYPILGTYTSDLSNMEWASTDPTGCLTFRVVMDGSQSCSDGIYPPIAFTLDCNPFFLNVQWEWSPGEFVVDSTAQNTTILDSSLVSEYVVKAFYDGIPECYSSDTVHVVTFLNAEWLAFQPDCDVSNGTLVIDVDSPGYTGGEWIIALTPEDSTMAPLFEPSNGDPMAFTFLPNGIYGVNISNDNCEFSTDLELNSEENESPMPCGCTYPIFPNYDPTALIDDGSCAFEEGDGDGDGGGGGGGGCDYVSWCEEYYEDECQADLNNDGGITISDLLEMMQIFGSLCEETPN